MKKKKLKLTGFTTQKIDENLLNNIYAGSDSELCGNTCDCTCTCESQNTQQKNSNINGVSTSNRDTSFVSVFVDNLVDNPTIYF